MPDEDKRAHLRALPAGDRRAAPGVGRRARAGRAVRGAPRRSRLGARSGRGGGASFRVYARERAAAATGSTCPRLEDQPTATGSSSPRQPGVGLLLLREVQPQDRVQPVEDPPQVDRSSAVGPPRAAGRRAAGGRRGPGGRSRRARAPCSTSGPRRPSSRRRRGRPRPPPPPRAAGRRSHRKSARPRARRAVSSGGSVPAGRRSVRIRWSSGANSACSPRKRSATSVAGAGRPCACPIASARSAFRIDGDVDHLLDERADHGREATRTRPKNMKPNARPMPISTLCIAIRPRALRDRHRVGEPVEPVHDQHDVGRLAWTRWRRGRPSPRRRRRPRAPARRSARRRP